MKSVNGQWIILTLLATLLTTSAQSAFALSTSQTATQNANRSIDKDDQNDKESDTTKPTDKESEPIAPNSPLLIVDVTTDRNHAYIHEQILITVQVGAPAAAFAINGGTFQVAHSQITVLNQTQINRQIEKVDYRFQKIVYAVFAEKSGELVFPSITYTATLPVSSQADLPVTKSVNEKKRNKNPRLRASSEPVKIQINEPPPTAITENNAARQAHAGKNQNGNNIWLPAVDVKLSSSWQGTLASDGNTESKTIIPAGTPVKRLVLIDILGQDAKRIPLHEQRVDEPQRQYPDQPVLERNLTPVSLNGSKLLSATLIAPEAGNFLLPALSIEWWDINKKTWRTSLLQAETFEVIAIGAAQTATQAVATHPDSSNALQRTIQRLHPALIMLSILLVLLAIALTMHGLQLWWRKKQSIQHTTNATLLAQKVPKNEAEAWRILRKKLNGKELHGIRQSLLNWAGKRWPKQNMETLEQVKLCVPEIDESLSKLEELLYSQHNLTQHEQARLPEAEKQLKSLRKHLVKMRKNPLVGNHVSERNTQDGELQPLYPTNHH